MLGWSSRIGLLIVLLLLTIGLREARGSSELLLHAGSPILGGLKWLVHGLLLEGRP